MRLELCADWSAGRQVRLSACQGLDLHVVKGHALRHARQRCSTIVPVCFLHMFSIYLFHILQPGKGANGPVLLRGLLEDRDAVHAEGVPVWHQRLLRGTKGSTVRQGATSRIRARTTPAQIGHLPALAKLRVLLGDAQIRAVCQVGGMHVNAKCGKSWWVFLFSECVNTIPFLQTSPPRSSGWNV